MTIKVEREALLRLLSTPPSTPLLEPPIRCHEEIFYIDIPKPAFAEDCSVQKLRESYDDESVTTVSTASLSSADSDDEDYDCRRVSFAESLVTDEWTREYTRKDEISSLYYSTEDTQR
jgi:hypothetical protein